MPGGKWKEKNVRSHRCHFLLLLYQVIGKDSDKEVFGLDLKEVEGANCVAV